MVLRIRFLKCCRAENFFSRLLTVCCCCMLLCDGVFLLIVHLIFYLLLLLLLLYLLLSLLLLLLPKTLTWHFKEMMAHVLCLSALFCVCVGFAECNECSRDHRQAWPSFASPA